MNQFIPISTAGRQFVRQTDAAAMRTYLGLDTLDTVYARLGAANAFTSGDNTFAGNVGIGTASPIKPLHVESATNALAYLNTGAGKNAGFIIAAGAHSGAAGNTFYGLFIDGDNTAGGYLPGGGTGVLRLTSYHGGIDHDVFTVTAETHDIIFGGTVTMNAQMSWGSNLIIQGVPTAFAQPIVIGGVTPKAFIYLDSSYGVMRIGSQSTDYPVLAFELPVSGSYADVVSLGVTSMGPSPGFDNAIRLGVPGGGWKSIYAYQGILQAYSAIPDLLTLKGTALQAGNLLTCKDVLDNSVAELKPFGRLVIDQRTPLDTDYSGGSTILNLKSNGGTVFAVLNSGNPVFTRNLEMSYSSDSPAGLSLGAFARIGFNTASGNINLNPLSDQIFIVKSFNAPLGSPTISVYAPTTTTAKQLQAGVDTAWADDTVGTRKGRIRLLVNDASGEREGVRVESDGTKALVGIGGAVTAGVTLTVTALSSTVVPLVAKGVALQSGNLFEAQSSTTTVAFIGPGGEVVSSTHLIGGGLGGAVLSTVNSGAQANLSFNAYPSTGGNYTAGVTGAQGLFQFDLASGSLVYYTAAITTAGAQMNPGQRLAITAGGDVACVGDIEITNSSKGIILKSPDGTRYRITVANGGTLTVTSI